MGRKQWAVGGRPLAYLPAGSWLVKKLSSMLSADPESHQIFRSRRRMYRAGPHQEKWRKNDLCGRHEMEEDEEKEVAWHEQPTITGKNNRINWFLNLALGRLLLFAKISVRIGPQFYLFIRANILVFLAMKNAESVLHRQRSPKRYRGHQKKKRRKDEEA